MVHIKRQRIRDLMIVAVLAMFIIIIGFFIKSLDLSAALNKAAMNLDSVALENIYSAIIHKALPTVDISMSKAQSKEDRLSAYNILQSIIDLDINNPRTYLQSEIPLLGLFDISSREFNAQADAKIGGIREADAEQEREEISKAVSGTEFFGLDPLDISKIDRENPAVIILHTHATESYTPTPKYNYVMMGDYRTVEREYSVCRVGEEIKNCIERYYGLAVVHDTTLHDYPSYNDSYDRSKPTTEELIKKYPNAKLIIDLHRDAFEDEDGTARDKMVSQIDEEKAAKIMFVVGKSNPHWQENYYLSLKLNQRIEGIWPGLTRQIYATDWGLYNQDISNKMVLVEIGSVYNTLEESLVSAKVVAKAIGDMLKEDEEP